METKEAIFLRRSIRAYENRPVSDKDLQEILETGMYAPSAVNYQPWYFVVIRTPEQMERLYTIMRQVSLEMEPALRERFSKHPGVVEETTRFLRKLGGAPVCILAFPYKKDYPKTSETITESVAAAIENMLLAATDKGLGSCWLTAPVEVGLGAHLRDAFAPGRGDLLALITLGYAAQSPKTPARKDGRYIMI